MNDDAPQPCDLCDERKQVCDLCDDPTPRCGICGLPLEEGEAEVCFVCAGDPEKRNA